MISRVSDYTYMNDPNGERYFSNINGTVMPNASPVKYPLRAEDVAFIAEAYSERQFAVRGNDSIRATFSRKLGQTYNSLRTTWDGIRQYAIDPESSLVTFPDVTSLTTFRQQFISEHGVVTIQIPQGDCIKRNEFLKYFENIKKTRRIYVDIFRDTTLTGRMVRFNECPSGSLYGDYSDEGAYSLSGKDLGITPDARTSVDYWQSFNDTEALLYKIYQVGEGYTDVDRKHMIWKWCQYHYVAPILNEAYSKTCVQVSGFPIGCKVTPIVKFRYDGTVYNGHVEVNRETPRNIKTWSKYGFYCGQQKTAGNDRSNVLSWTWGELAGSLNWGSLPYYEEYMADPDGTNRDVKSSPDPSWVPLTETNYMKRNEHTIGVSIEGFVIDLSDRTKFWT